jgi:hypothetical protein
MSTRPPDRLERRVWWFSTICANNQAMIYFFDEVMTFPGVSQPESNDYFPPLAKNRIAFDHVFFDLFSIIAFWYARTTRRVILHNLREKSAASLIFWWSYCNFCPLPVTNYFPSYLTLGRVPGPALTWAQKIVRVLYVCLAQNSGHCNDKARLVLYAPRTKTY